MIGVIKVEQPITRQNIGGISGERKEEGEEFWHTGEARSHEEETGSAKWKRSNTT